MADSPDNIDLDALLNPKHKRAEFIYGLASFLCAVFLLSQFKNQTVWVEGLAVSKQPAFWPIVSITGMVLFGTFELFFSWRRFTKHKGAPVLSEVLFWLCSVEWALWFIAYVLVVPYLGYILSTWLFFAALSLRLGYTGLRMVAIALLSGTAIVVVFKSFLSVRIPGGAIYQYLPDALRNFMIINF